MLPKAPSLVLLALLSTGAYCQTLIEALKANNATQFAAALENNQTLLAIFTASDTRTVFAPIDGPLTNGTVVARDDDRDFSLQASESNTDASQIRYPGRKFQVKSQAKDGSLLDLLAEKGVNKTDDNPTNQKRQFSNSTAPVDGITFASGLGNQVNLVKSNIPYDNGMIQLTNGYFTPPSSLSSTVASTGLTSLQAALAQANLSDSLTGRQSLTMFLPSNAAFALASSTTPQDPDELTRLLLHHAIPDAKLSLPDLTDGATFTTLAGTTLTVAIKDGGFFINGAKIVTSNIITDSGVTHVINRVLVPPPPPFTGGASSLRPGLITGVVAAVCAFVYIVV